MRVALLTHNARTGDAVGNQVAAKAAFFRDRGADLRPYVESDREMQPSLRSNLRVVNSDEPLSAIAAELAEFDLLCVEYSQYYRLLEVLPLFGPRPPKILIDYHGVTPPDLWDGPPEMLRESQRRRGLIWFADEVIVHSRFMRRELESAIRYPSDRIHETPLFLEVAASEPAPGSLRRRLGLTDERILLFVGRLAANKRVPVLIEAVGKMTDARPAVHAVVVGDTGDLYQNEFQQCRDLADKLGVGDRVHFLGRVLRDELCQAYRAADAFVMPSKHEGFCVPILEAMAHGVPVVAARAGALSETLGDAGLSFQPDDADDLARQIRRIWGISSTPIAKTSQRAIAVVAAKYGDDVLGGAERSLRLIAESLVEAGHSVEVFTTGTATRNETIKGVLVHRYLVDPVDADLMVVCTQELRTAGKVSEKTAQDYFALTRISTPLLAAVAERREDLIAVIVGPYSNGLTWAVAERFPGLTLLLPCFHDEPLARCPLIRDGYSGVAGALYHSAEEQFFAQTELELQQPNSEIIGTWLNPANGNAERGRTIARQTGPYLVYCGRYCREKGVATLSDWFQQYSAEFPERFGMVFTGAGAAEFPTEITDLGFLSETDKTDVVAGAAAFVLLSKNESLSLGALEAWRESVPVISHSDCTVLAGHQLRSGGGASVVDFDEFRAALNDLWQHREEWLHRGEKGRDFVLRDYSDRAKFVSQLESVLASMSEPLKHVMRRKGLHRAAAFTPQAWTDAFAKQIERILDRDPVESVSSLEIITKTADGTISVSPMRRRIAVRVRNNGNVPLLSDGPSRIELFTQVYTTDGQLLGPVVPTRLSEILVPGYEIRLAVRLTTPKRPGEYRIGFHTGSKFVVAAGSIVRLIVTKSKMSVDAGGLAAVHDAISATEATATLPAGYQDVTEGRLASWKRAIKRKLLHQFQTSYVDVLSRQQSEFNRSLLAALQELTECTATLERAVFDDANPAESDSNDLSATVRRLNKTVRQAVGRIADLEKRLERMESLLMEPAAMSPGEGRL